MHHKEMIELRSYSPGTQRSLAVHRFGQSGARPKVYVQAGLHADELPANLAAIHLVERLKAADAAGQIIGEIIVVPLANPVGTANIQHRQLQGRYHTASGQNFNRNVPNVANSAVENVGASWSADAEANMAALRKSIAACLDSYVAANEAQDLQLQLIKQAFDADIVLDLHTDAEAELHLYLDPDLWPQAQDLAGLLDAKVVMFARASGDSPFEETCTLPYLRTREAGHDVALPFACVVELRGERDVSAELADKDADALLTFLKARGSISGNAGELPKFTGIAADFSATQVLFSSAPGIIVFKQPVGAMVEPDTVIAEIVNPLTVDTTPPEQVTAQSAGRFFARTSERLAYPGSVIGKIQSKNALPGRESGNLLYD